MIKSIYSQSISTVVNEDYYSDLISGNSVIKWKFVLGSNSKIESRSSCAFSSKSIHSITNITSMKITCSKRDDGRNFVVSRAFVNIFDVSHAMPKYSIKSLIISGIAIIISTYQCPSNGNRHLLQTFQWLEFTSFDLNNFITYQCSMWLRGVHNSIAIV